MGIDEGGQQGFSPVPTWYVAGDEGLGLGHRLELQGDLSDDGQRTQRTGEQLAKIVASDIFHDAAAPFEGHAAAVHGA